MPFLVDNPWSMSEEQSWHESLAWCPCLPQQQQQLSSIMDHSYGRLLEDSRSTQDDDNSDDSTSAVVVWEIVYTCLVLAGMFFFLVTDRLGADSIMLTALTCFMAAEIISLSEGLAGFSNTGLLTVLVLFVVAEGISKTGALDWYMGKLLGHPSGTAAAQLKLMTPIFLLSGFLNNTPVVAVMIPIVQRWAKNIRVSAQQLLIPLSFASILGGTCTLIGTSTNLVVVGLLDERYDGEISIGLFDLGQYGVPVAMAGLAYILLFSPIWLPGNATPLDDGSDDILLGARLTQWSPAAGRTVQRSGLRDTGGIFLVSVHRATTGNVHRAVSNDFVLNAGDILYFTGLLESFGEFCQEHGLEVMTNELEETGGVHQDSAAAATSSVVEAIAVAQTNATTGFDNHDSSPALLTSPKAPDEVQLVAIGEDSNLFLDELTGIPIEVGVTKESLLHADEAERMLNINQMTDLIRSSTKRDSSAVPGGAVKIVVTIDRDLVVVGINAHDRPGLLLDIAKGLLRFNLQLHHTEAAVLGDRSISIWRCEVNTTELPDVEEIWSVLNALLSDETGVEAMKERGLRVIRARVLKGSRLVGQTAAQVNFRHVYKAAIVAIRNHQKSASTKLSTIRFEVNDTLILQASDDSPLLRQPDPDFYKLLMADATRASNNGMPRTPSVGNFVRKLRGRSASFDSRENLASAASTEAIDASVIDARQQPSSGEDGGFFIPSDDEGLPPNENVDITEALENAETGEPDEAVWKDLQVVFQQTEEGSTQAVTREFLTAMAVAPHSQFSGNSATHAGLNKLPDLFLVSIDRPIVPEEGEAEATRMRARLSDMNGPSLSSVGDDHSVLSSIRTENKVFDAIDLDQPLLQGDILWFSGPAFAVGDLRKIPGLVSYENEEVEKIHGKIFDRRLVQAVISRKGPLVGRTVKEVRFRTRYGAAVIAVHREGKRVHEHPGKVKLQAGDVLLLEAGPTFDKAFSNDKSFALLAEVEDSAPPRLRLLIPALLITAGMLAVFMAGLTSLLVSGLVASILMVALGIISEQEARDAVNWEVYITIASAFGIGTALVNSGVADAIANFLVEVGTAVNLGDAGLIGAVYFATFLISNVVTNNAAAALIFPIAMNAAEQTGIDRTLMSYSLMLGASASFMSPFGYTTNLLIYGPGGYKYNDFLKFGTPMQLVLWILSTLYLAVIKDWYISWIATGAILVIVAVVRIGTPAVRIPGRKMKA